METVIVEKMVEKLLTEMRLVHPLALLLIMVLLIPVPVLLFVRRM